ncbi:KEL2 Kelch repeat-containing protein 2 [Candida maltosa Xu316]
MYIHGGNDFSGIIYSALYVLDLDTLEWTKLPDQGEENGPGPRCGHSMTWLPKFNKIVIMGGDKNDYVDSDPHNFDTFEELVGSEIGTMIYELDVPVFDRYVTSLHAPVIIPQPITTKPHPQVPQQQDKVPVELPREQNHDEEDEEEEEVGGYSRAKRVAASAVVPNPRHGRSVSAGPEEFETPQGSIRGESPDRRNEDNFVEVDLPSTNLSQLDYDSVAGENSNGRSNGSEEPGRRRSLDPRQDLPPSDSKVNESREVNPTIGAAGVIGAAAAVGAAAAATASSNNNNHNKGLVADDSFTEREANSTVVSVPKSGEHDGKVKKIISELTNELVQLKASTKEQMQRATDKIEQLERQNSLLQQSQQRDVDHYTKQLNDKDVLINELKSSLDPSAWDPEQPQGETNISEVNRYKLERLELNNKLVYLEQENTKLKEKFEEFEPFMDNQIGELDKFQKVIKVQEQQIEKLSSQVKDQEGLHKEINDWKSKHENLALEFENYRAIHNDDEISDSEAELHNNNSHDDRSVLSSARSRRDISSHLENLVQLWNHKNSREPSVPVDTNNAVVAKLQAQVDDLLKNVEDNYRESIQSVNNTSKALKLNQDELNNQRTLMERLSKENNELKMLKKALGSRDGTPVVNEYKNIQDEEVISTAHYNMKIKDLEADLYILKQERDQLKDNVTSLQKQLYLAQNN